MKKKYPNQRDRFVYVLVLEGGYYYVGTTTNVERRYQEHVNGSGSEWTQLHKPESILKTVQCSTLGESLIIEDALTLWLMAKYSKMSVRGGRWMKEGHEHIYGYSEARKIVQDDTLSKKEVRQAFVDIIKWTIPDHSWYWDDMFQKFPKLKRSKAFQKIGVVPKVVKQQWEENKAEEENDT